MTRNGQPRATLISATLSTVIIFLTALSGIAGGFLTSAPSGLPTFFEHMRDHPVLWAIGLLVISALAGTGFVFWQSRSDHSRHSVSPESPGRGPIVTRRRIRAGAITVLGVSLSCVIGSTTTYVGGKLSFDHCAVFTASSQLALYPRDKSALVTVSTEIKLSVGEAISDELVTLIDSSGVAVPMAQRPGKLAWVPNNPLMYDSFYTVVAKARRHNGCNTTATATFTTMQEPTNRVRLSSYYPDYADHRLGIAASVRLHFSRDIEPKARQGILSRMFVSILPLQEAAWSWVGRRELVLRGKEYWLPGTTINVRGALKGHPLGGDWYGQNDLLYTHKISNDRVELLVDLRSMQMVVQRNGDVVRTLVVSSGSATRPCLSGKHVIVERQEEKILDTTNDPNVADRYRINVKYAQMLTYSGQYIYASASTETATDTPAGCINVSAADGAFLFGITRIGDPVIVTGTSSSVERGDGFAEWSVPWDDWVAP